MSVYSLTVTAIDSPDGVAVVHDRKVTLARELEKRVVSLTADPPAWTAVSLDGMTSVSVLHVEPQDGAKVDVRLTSGDGSQQIIPVDDLMIIISRSVPFTAIDLGRVAGQATVVHLFLGQKF